MPQWLILSALKVVGYQTQLKLSYIKTTADSLDISNKYSATQPIIPCNNNNDQPDNDDNDDAKEELKQMEIDTKDDDVSMNAPGSVLNISLLMDYSRGGIFL